MKGSVKILKRNASKTFLSGFSRITTSRKFIPQIDGLRFVALAFVFVLHLNHQVVPRAVQALTPSPDGSVFSRLLESGEFGVQLFFALSGFILAMPFASHYLTGTKKVSLKGFYLRRLTRLEPPLIINLSIVFLLMIFALGRNAEGLLPHLMATMVYLHNFIYHESSIISAVTWSLEVEVQFYLLTPLLTLLFLIKKRWLRRGGIVFAAVICIVIDPYFPKWTLPSQLEHFLAGFLLVDLYLTEWKSHPEDELRISWDFAGAISWVAMIALLYFQNRFTSASYLIPVTVLIAYCATFRGKFFSWLSSRSFFVTVGGMCYTIYLYHLVILSVVTRVTAKFLLFENYYFYYLFSFLIIAPITLVLSAVLFRLFERPFMNPNWPHDLRICIFRKSRVESDQN